AVGPMIGRRELGTGRLFRLFLIAASDEPDVIQGEGILRYQFKGTPRELRFEVKVGPSQSKLIAVPIPAEAAADSVTSTALEIVFEQPSHVILDAVSMDNAGELGLEVRLRSQTDASNPTGSYPVDIGNSSTATVVIENTDSKPALFRSGMIYEGGEYVLPTIEVPAKGAVELNISDFYNIPDLLGNTLPFSVTSGQFYWIQDKPGATLI